MKPSAYIKLYAGDWLKDTLHLDATCQGAYFMLVLAHRGKPGIPCDDDTLRTIARVKESDWARVKGQIRCFFKELDGLWVNQRSVEDWERDVEDYKAACNRTAKARAASNPLKHPVTPPVTPPVTGQQSESESESEAVLRNKQTNNAPSLEQVKEAAKMLAMQEADAADFWNHFESSGWIDKNGNRIVNWRAKMQTWKVVARGKPFEHAHHSAGGNGQRPKTTFELKTILEAKKALAQDLRGRYCSEAGVSVTWTDQTKRTEYVTLRREIKEMTTQLSSM